MIYLYVDLVEDFVGNGSYLVLKREINIIKAEFLDDIKRNYLEKNNKINVNAHDFIKDINQWLDGKNFNIF